MLEYSNVDVQTQNNFSTRTACSHNFIFKTRQRSSGSRLIYNIFQFFGQNIMYQVAAADLSGRDYFRHRTSIIKYWAPYRYG